MNGCQCLTVSSSWFWIKSLPCQAQRHQLGRGWAKWMRSRTWRDPGVSHKAPTHRFSRNSSQEAPPQPPATSFILVCVPDYGLLWLWSTFHNFWWCLSCLALIRSSTKQFWGNGSPFPSPPPCSSLIPHFPQCQRHWAWLWVHHLHVLSLETSSVFSYKVLLFGGKSNRKTWQCLEELHNTGVVGNGGQGCLLDTSDTSHQRWDPQPALPNPLVHAMVQILMIEPDKTRAGIPTSQRSINQHT